ncbi:MAG: DNA photolyase family protein [Alphaproteobacteria bacterium]|nr:DNA photolyase family protein [Alphaproteobacteria bacterium]
MPTKKTLFWFRQDLRISDNPGLYEAAKQGAVMPVYIQDEKTAGDFKMGEASLWWLYHSLTDLNNSLNNTLNVYQGNAKEILLRLVKDNCMDAIYWNRCYEPQRIKEDTDIKSSFKAENIDCQSFNGSLLLEPWQVVKSDGNPYKVFTPFYQKGYLGISNIRRPLPKLEKLDLIKEQSNKTTITQLNLLSDKNWHKKIEPYWTIGEKGAREKLQTFLNEGLLYYKEGRNFPGKNNTSRLSPHLHFGEISPNQVWFEAATKGLVENHLRADLDCFLSELGWREFSYNLLYYFPDLPHKNLQSKFDMFPWENNLEDLKAWQQGQTGYPIVDAGMRELWQTGYMHNRVRMIVGSFLVKNLLLHWHHGEKWFWDCLVDADLANNSASWQWIAGCGADAAPYFRIFNPITQGEKFDPEGNYTRHFVPELANMPNKYLFRPWQAPVDILERAGVVLGYNYPKPIINLEFSRHRALEAFASLPKTSLSII